MHLSNFIINAFHLTKVQYLTILSNIWLHQESYLTSPRIIDNLTNNHRLPHKKHLTSLSNILLGHVENYMVVIQTDLNCAQIWHFCVTCVKGFDHRQWHMTGFQLWVNRDGCHIWMMLNLSDREFIISPVHYIYITEFVSLFAD